MKSNASKNRVTLEHYLREMSGGYAPSSYDIERTRLRLWSKIDVYKASSPKMVLWNVIQKVVSGIISVVFVFVLFATFLFGSTNNSLAEDIGQLSIKQGTVYITRSSQRFEARPSEPLKEGDIIEVNDGASAEVSFSSKKRATLGNDTRVKVNSSKQDSDVHINLSVEKGSVSTVLDHDTTQNTLTVHTPTSIIEAGEGSSFDLTVDPKTKKDSIKVEESTVAVLERSNTELEGKVTLSARELTSGEELVLDQKQEEDQIDKDNSLVATKEQGGEKAPAKKHVKQLENKPTIQVPDKLSLTLGRDASIKQALPYIDAARIELRGVVEAMKAGDGKRAKELALSYKDMVDNIADKIEPTAQIDSPKPYVDQYTDVGKELSESKLKDLYHLWDATEGEKTPDVTSKLEELFAFESSTILHAELSTLGGEEGGIPYPTLAQKPKSNDLTKHLENQVVSRIESLEKIPSQDDKAQALVDLLSRIPTDSRNYDIVERMYEEVDENLKGYVRIKLYAIKGAELHSAKTTKVTSGSGTQIQE